MEDIQLSLDGAIVEMRRHFGDAFTIGFLTDLFLRMARTSVGMRLELEKTVSSINAIVNDPESHRRPVRDSLVVG